MAAKHVSELNAASTLTGSEIMLVEQSGQSVKTTLGDIAKASITTGISQTASYTYNGNDRVVINPNGDNNPPTTVKLSDVFSNVSTVADGVIDTAFEEASAATGLQPEDIVLIYQSNGQALVRKKTDLLKIFKIGALNASDVSSVASTDSVIIKSGTGSNVDVKKISIANISNGIVDTGINGMSDASGTPASTDKVIIITNDGKKLATTASVVNAILAGGTTISNVANFTTAKDKVVLSDGSNVSSSLIVSKGIATGGADSFITTSTALITSDNKTATVGSIVEAGLAAATAGDLDETDEIVLSDNTQVSSSDILNKGLESITTADITSTAANLKLVTQDGKYSTASNVVSKGLAEIGSAAAGSTATTDKIVLTDGKYATSNNVVTKGLSGIAAYNSTNDEEIDTNTDSIILETNGNFRKVLLADISVGGSSGGGSSTSINFEGLSKNSVARGKDLGNGTVYTSSTIGDALNSWINGGNFGDVYVGDYFVMKFPVADSVSVASGTNRNIKFRIAGFNLFLHTGSTELTTPHIVIVPDQFLQTGSRMHSSNDCASTGFAGTELFTTIIGGESITGTNTINKKLSTLFGSHLISHMEYLSSSINTSKDSTAYPGNTGVAGAYTPKTVYANIMNAQNLWGSNISNSIFETSVYNGQFPLFRLMPEYSVGTYFTDAATTTRGYTWLRDIVYHSSSSTYFGYCYSNGRLNCSYASSSYSDSGVRPYFLLG